MLAQKHCLNCGVEIEGRIDKKFCNNYCKTNFHYRNRKQKDATLYELIDQQLKHNRNLLKHFSVAGKAVIRKIELHKKGFSPKYFTHYWKNQKGDVYLFCYEFGFLAKNENGVDKYVLVQWQEYMESGFQS
jgi:predicted nucleic acid-binding Zn ribbon protein